MSPKKKKVSKIFNNYGDLYLINLKKSSFFSLFLSGDMTFQLTPGILEVHHSRQREQPR